MNIQESNARIIELLAEGKTYKEIACILNMRYWTLIDRVREMKKRNNCQSRDQLIVKMLAPTLCRMTPGA